MLVEKIQKYLINLQESALAIIKVILLSKFKTEIHLTKKEKNCVILGNGPSISELIKNYNSFLKNKDVICVNFFPLSGLYAQIKPSLLVVSATELWRTDVNEDYIKKGQELFSSLNNKTNWPLKLFIPFSARKTQHWKKELEANKNIEIVYYNNTGVEGFQRFLFFLFRKNLAMPRPHNVLLVAIFNAINLGYQNIYLWGAENNQFLEMSVDENNNALILQKHFYDSQGNKAEIMTKAGTGKRKVHEILNKFRLAFMGYHILNEYAISQNVKVVNQTPGSMIDAFKRSKLD